MCLKSIKIDFSKPQYTHDILAALLGKDVVFNVVNLCDIYGLEGRELTEFFKPKSKKALTIYLWNLGTLPHINEWYHNVKATSHDTFPGYPIWHLVLPKYHPVKNTKRKTTHCVQHTTPLFLERMPKSLHMSSAKLHHFELSKQLDELSDFEVGDHIMEEVRHNLIVQLIYLQFSNQHFNGGTYHVTFAPNVQKVINNTTVEDFHRVCSKGTFYVN